MGGKKVSGNGNLVTRDRNISGFDGVETFGEFDVSISTANESSVKVEAEENLQSYIETVVDGSTLQIRTKPGYNLRPNEAIKIFVYGPRFGTIASYGSGNINGQNTITSNTSINLRVAGSGNIQADLNAQEVSAEIAGSGNIGISGTSKDFKSKVMGSGNVKAGKLQTENSSVNIAGSGNAEVSASNRLDVKVMGSGDVRYRGGPQVNSEIAGSGSVIKID